MLQRLEREGILCPVKSSTWSPPIVPVLKQDGSVRICGDIKVTDNPVASLEMYLTHELRTCQQHCLVERNSESWICEMPTNNLYHPGTVRAHATSFWRGLWPVQSSSARWKNCSLVSHVPASNKPWVRAEAACLSSLVPFFAEPSLER